MASHVSIHYARMDVVDNDVVAILVEALLLDPGLLFDDVVRFEITAAIWYLNLFCIQKSTFY